MKIRHFRNSKFLPPLISLLTGLGIIAFTIQGVAAKSSNGAVYQDGEAADEPLDIPEKDCQECHLDVTEHWSHSPHAHAFDDEVFQDRWLGLGKPGECLVCHTTDFQQSTGEYAAEGVECQACHGEVKADHPPAPVPIKADTEYCGICHTTTLGEWRLTGHSTVDIGCTNCHDPHSQQALFENADEMCLNCHKESMGEYLEDLHVLKGIGCVDCHALVIPPDEIPEDGIVPTGHTFTITPATCIACHTDTLHAGFSLPGYENGASVAHVGQSIPKDGEAASGESDQDEEESGLSPEQRLQTLEAALASQNISILFQGGLVGLVLGGSTAWIVANNVRHGRKEDNEDDQPEQ